MGRKRTEPADAAETQTPEEAEREAAERGNGTGDEQEVRPEEFTQGTGEPVWASPLPAEVVEELRQPLSPDRVRTRKGRGGGKFEYLAGHDDKRRANELFGFGNWGYTIETLTEQAAVQVTSDHGKDGWHVAYMATVRVEVRGCFPFSDVGYGDGVEYGPAALATARELAMKEAVTDAMKRALTGWGDQFGLVLYAKDDERKRIDRDRNAEGAQPAVRVEHERPVPQTWAEAGQRLAAVLGGPGAEDAREAARIWLAQALKERYAVEGVSALGERTTEAGRRFSGTVWLIEERHGDLALTTGVREKVAQCFAERWDGIAVIGPPWRLGPDEAGFPTYDEWKAAQEPPATAPGTDAQEAPGAPEAAAGTETPAEPAEPASAPEAAS